MPDHVRAAQHRRTPAERGGVGAGRVAQIEPCLREGVERAGGERRAGAGLVGAEMRGEDEDRHRLRTHDPLDGFEP